MEIFVDIIILIIGLGIIFLTILAMIVDRAERRKRFQGSSNWQSTHELEQLDRISLKNELGNFESSRYREDESPKMSVGTKVALGFLAGAAFEKMSHKKSESGYVDPLSRRKKRHHDCCCDDCLDGWDGDSDEDDCELW